jgi:hypothetical protein
MSTVMTASADVANTVPAVLLTTATAYSAHDRAADPAAERQVRPVANHNRGIRTATAGYEHFPLRVFADGLADQSPPWINLLIVILRTGHKIHTMTSSVCTSYHREDSMTHEMYHSLLRRIRNYLHESEF